MIRREVLGTALAAFVGLGLLGSKPDAASVTRIGNGVEVIFGSYPEGQQPDGNTVIFTGTDGLVVMDTGRHPAHVRQILDYAESARKPIAAIINSHWHLDHIGGNPRVREAYPSLRIYGSGALEQALRGFLAGYQHDLQNAIAATPDSPQIPAWREELELIAKAPMSLADERVDRLRTEIIAGRKLTLHIESHAVTAGDVWVFDPVTRVLAAGDLVTLPVPFLDTACPSGWKDALDNVAQEPFKTLVPGHGLPMNRAAFGTYRRAYATLIACASAADTPNAACVSGWMHDADTLIPGSDRQRAREMLNYYVTKLLRGNPARIAQLCAA